MAVIIVPPTAEGEHMVRKRKLTCIFPHPRAQPFWGCHSRFVLPELFRPGRLCIRQLPRRQRRGWCSALAAPAAPRAGDAAGGSAGCDSHGPAPCPCWNTAGAVPGRRRELDVPGVLPWMRLEPWGCRGTLGCRSPEEPWTNPGTYPGRGLGLGRSLQQPWVIHQL